MSASLKAFLWRWLVNTVAVMVATKVVRGIECGDVGALLAASLLLGIFNALLRPMLLLVSLPLVIVTMGFFALIINALLLYLVSHLVKSFGVANFSAAFWGSLVISLVSVVLNLVSGARGRRIEIRRGPAPPDRGDGDGPVIDV